MRGRARRLLSSLVPLFVSMFQVSKQAGNRVNLEGNPVDDDDSSAQEVEEGTYPVNKRKDKDTGSVAVTDDALPADAALATKYTPSAHCPRPIVQLRLA